MEAKKWWEKEREAEKFFSEQDSELLLSCMIDYAKSAARASIERNRDSQDFNEINMFAIRSILSKRLNEGN